MRPDLGPLADLSAKLGRDPEQVQAAGGNTSRKHEGVLWVKASGFWLMDADTRDIFVPVDIDKLHEGYESEKADPVGPAVIDELNPGNFRPSIETSLHAFLPHTYVVHTHSVRTIALAIRTDWEEQLNERLQGLNWCFVPYVKPGLDLTRGLQTAMAGNTPDIVILGNHGLVVGGESLDEVEERLRLVERRLDGPPMTLPQQNQNRRSPPKGWRHVTHQVCDAIATPSQMRKRALAGSLYPDHVIFLGPAAIDRKPAEPTSKLWLDEDFGALLPEDAGKSEDEMALCLTLVLARVPADAKLNYLSADDEASLLNWDAEKYRQDLAKKLSSNQG